MERCRYLEYEQTFLLARGALLSGDLETLRQLSAGNEARSLPETMAISLALTDAKRGSRRRGKPEVCNALALVCGCDAGDPRRSDGEQRPCAAGGLLRRSARRIARAFQVDLRLRRELVRAVTLDVSPGGFSALLGKAPSEDARVEFALRLPRADAVKGVARVVSSVPRDTDHRVSFCFESVSTASLRSLGAICVAG
jgi:hypothetical protein